MKKVLPIVSAIVLFVFGGTVAAQETSFGAKAGVNLANLTGDDVGDTDMKIGLHLGGYANIMFSDLLGLSPELLFSTQGAKSETETTIPFFGTIKAKGNLKLTYINVPLLLKVVPTEGFNIHVGPQIGFLLSAKSELEVNGESSDEDVKDSFKSTDFGLAAGAGYELPSGLNFGLRYNTSLGSIYDGDGDGKNSVIQVSAGYTFGR